MKYKNLNKDILKGGNNIQNLINDINIKNNEINIINTNIKLYTLYNLSINQFFENINNIKSNIKDILNLFNINLPSIIETNFYEDNNYFFLKNNLNNDIIYQFDKIDYNTLPDYTNKINLYIIKLLATINNNILIESLKQIQEKLINNINTINQSIKDSNIDLTKLQAKQFNQYLIDNKFVITNKKGKVAISYIYSSILIFIYLFLKNIQYS